MSLPPPTPTFILRGHSSAIHALHFYRRNSRLISGDADGHVVIWDMQSKRAVACWKAHGGAVLGVGCWGNDGERVISHGRDHRLRVWQVREEDERHISKALPVNADQSASKFESADAGGDASDGRDPWLLHSLEVNTLNFCAFAMCDDRIGNSFLQNSKDTKEEVELSNQGASKDLSTPEQVPRSEPPFPSPQPSPILIALPNALNTGGIDIFHLPSEKRLFTILASESITTGMVMAVAIAFIKASTSTPLQSTNPPYLIVVAGYESGHTSIYSCHQTTSFKWRHELLYNTNPHTQPVLSLALDPALTTAEQYYITTSADSMIAKHPLPTSSVPPSTQPSTPLNVTNTHHASQQSITIRADGKIFATAGWDGRVRVYGVRDMKEKAVLKWHRDGVYAVAFAAVERSEQVPDGQLSDGGASERRSNTDESVREIKDEKGEEQLIMGGPLESSLDRIRVQRRLKAQHTHWIAAGGKDGKISLWDVF